MAKRRNGRSNGQVATKAKPKRQPSRVSEEIPSRIPVMKTYKIFIGGKFPRTESGRYYLLRSATNEPIANMCLCSRKDFRDAVVAARTAFAGWSKRTAYNRAQILYRIAEMLEGRSQQFVGELIQQGLDPSQAQNEVALSIDRVLYYAGWADKYQQVFSSVNPVSSSHFNFSVLEPTGVVSAIAPVNTGLLGLLSVTIPAIAGGNAVIALASESKPLSAVTLAEVLATSDLPGGVINLLTGRRSELVEHFASHMDVNACIYCGDDKKDIATMKTKAALNMKRAVIYKQKDWTDEKHQSPYLILDTQETKTTWHPVGI